MDQLKKYLAGEPIIKRFLRETGQTIDWLLDNVRIEPNEGDPLTWPVSWPAEDLPPCHISILQEAALLVWFYQDKGTDEQRDRVRDRITIASMGPDFICGQTLKKCRSAGGAATAEIRAQEAANTRTRICEIWDKLAREERPVRERAEVIAKRLNLNSRTVRSHLKKAERR